MPQPSSNNPLPLPTWVMVIGSLAVAGHLSIIAVSVLAARSGPWVGPFVSDWAEPPWFARTLDPLTRDRYLRPLRLTHNYHFLSNRFEIADVYLEVRLKNEAGEVTETVRIPDKEANPWAQHRQDLLARHLLDGDRPVPPPAGEVLPAPGQRAPTIQYWRQGPDRILRLHTEAQHLVPRNAPLLQPSEFSLTLARSYARYLCQRHNAASAEILRHSRLPLSPVVLLQQEIAPEATEEIVASYGEMSR